MEVPKNNHSESLGQQSDPKQFFYGWYLVAVGVFLLSISSLGVFRGMSPLMPVLQNKFGWTRTQISLSSLLTRVEGAALGPIEGFLIDRIGARKMVLIGFSIMAVGFVLFSFIQSLWQFYAVFILINLGNGIGGWLAVVTILNSWFRRKRTIAMAGAMSGILIAGIFVPPYTIALNHDFRSTVFFFGLRIQGKTISIHMNGKTNYKNRAFGAISLLLHKTGRLRRNPSFDVTIIMVQNRGACGAFLPQFSLIVFEI